MNSPSQKQLVIGFAIVSGLFFVSMLIFFFAHLDSTTSVYSAGGVTAPHQLFYNFLHGRAFQTSLFASQATGQSVGFSHNPYAYLHIFAIHTYFTPLLFAYVWGLWPTLQWLYGLILLVNYVGMAIFAWKILKLTSPKSANIKTSFALSILLASGFLFTFQQNAQLLMFGGPFLLSAYYFLLRRSTAPFLLSLAALCCVSEDAAMLAIMLCAYACIFEREARRMAVIGGIIALIYLSIALMIIQPAARNHLTLTDLNTTMVVLKHILNFTPEMIHSRVIGFFPALFFLPSFGIAILLFGKTTTSWSKTIGLMLIVPLPHWGESAIVGASHHLMPVVTVMFMSFVLALGGTPDLPGTSPPLTKRKRLLLVCLVFVFAAGSLRTMISNLPEQALLPIYHQAGMEDKVLRIEQNVKARQSNQLIIETVGQLPIEKSLSYLTNSSVEGFIAGRSDIWAFPDNYDRTDYLVLQPGAEQSFFSLPPLEAGYADKAIASGKYAEGNAQLSNSSANAIAQYLVQEKGTHRTIINAPGVILLERIVPYKFDNPQITIGFGWIDGLFRQKLSGQSIGDVPRIGKPFRVD